MVTRKHVKIVNIITLAFAAMTVVSLALFIAGIWPVWNIFANAFAMNSLGLLSHVLTNVILHRENDDRMRNILIQCLNEIENLRMSFVLPGRLAKLRTDYLISKAKTEFLYLVRSDNSPLNEDTHLYTFRLGAIYDGNPVFVSVPASISNPRKKITDMETEQFLNFLNEEITPTAAKLINALLKNREYDKFDFNDELTVDILPAEQK